MRFVSGLFVLIAFSLNGNFAEAQTPFTRDFAVSESLRLTFEQRYADGVVMAQRMKQICPDDPACLDTQAAVALQVGAISVAATDFHDALVRNPADPIALYGKALTLLMTDQNRAALALLDQIDRTPLLGPAQSEISVARAACLTEIGDDDDALSALSQTADPAGQELTALIDFRQSGSNTDILKNCLQQAMIGGVPEVVEPPGIRLLLPQNHSGPTIEPSVVDPAVQLDLAQRFCTSNRPGTLKTVTGMLSISPPRTIPTGTTSINLSLDDMVIGASNAPPYYFNWDTSSASNGAHCLTFSLFNSSGTEIGIQDEYVTVLNSADPSGNDEPLSPDLTARVWNAMTIKPDYKIAEYELAVRLLNAHDEQGYETHILRAAALDPDYRDVRSRIHPLFIGQVPNKFPVPDGTTLPSSLGLSAGSASTAGFWAGSAHVREMALTFDDGPLPIPTAQLLDALRLADAHGTFFVVGMRAAQSPDSLRQMAADGDTVEDHTFTHPNLTQILPQHILQEILRTAVVIEATTGLWPHFLRPPGGNTNTLVLETAKACGMSGAFWTIDALPAEESGSPDGVAKWVLSRARPGAIVLMHNGMAATVAAIPELVQGLRAQGYKLVTIRQLAADALAGRRAGT